MARRLDLLLIRAHPELSRRKAREVIEKGQVSVAGRIEVDAGGLFDEQAAVSWDVNRRARRHARLALPRLYEDERVLVVDKPAGLLSVPTSPEAAGQEDTALARVQEYMRHLRPRSPFVGVVHRIDRGTSGALAFALDNPTRVALRALFRDHRIERRYVALVEGVPGEAQGSIDAPIHDLYTGKRRVARPGEPGRPAITRYRVRETFGDAALVELELETGRQHQIRVHLAHAGWPIVGDEAYRPDERSRLRLVVARPLLHAQTLAFREPQSGRDVRATSPLPEDFERALRQLRARRRSQLVSPSPATRPALQAPERPAARVPERRPVSPPERPATRVPERSSGPVAGRRAIRAPERPAARRPESQPARTGPQPARASGHRPRGPGRPAGPHARRGHGKKPASS